VAYLVPGTVCNRYDGLYHAGPVLVLIGRSNSANSIIPHKFCCILHIPLHFLFLSHSANSIFVYDKIVPRFKICSTEGTDPIFYIYSTGSNGSTANTNCFY